MNVLADRVAADLDELREIAEWFDKRGYAPNGDFIRDVANRYEVVFGAFCTKERREAGQ